MLFGVSGLLSVWYGVIYFNAKKIKLIILTAVSKCEIII